MSNERLSDEELAAEQALLDSTPGGRWHASSHGTMPDGSPNPNWFASVGDHSGRISHISKSLARFIAGSRRTIERLLVELRERRAADLKPEEVEALRDLRGSLMKRIESPFDEEQIAVLDKLLAAHGVRS